ncbi:hypothetical protein C8F01DRAFT_1109886 [Mycena amicta]|nr:hypothetical protein C8F01DRAFT_1109886 [Mycena amicta]
MLATLFLFALLHACHATTVTNISVGNTAIVFTPGWTNVSDPQSNATFLETTEFLSHLTATLPSSASSVSYFGYSRAGGSSYGYSLDCLSDCVLQTANGTDPNETTSVSAIFTLNNLDPSTNHTLRVYNLGDASSQITFDHLSVIVQDNEDAAPGISSSITTVSSTAARSTTVIQTATFDTTSSTLGPASSTASISRSSLALSTSTNPSSVTSSSSSATASAVSSDGSSNGASKGTSAGVSKKLVIGLTVFAVAVTGGILILLFVCVRRRRREQQGRFSSSQPSPTSSIIPIMEPPQMRTSLNTFSDRPALFPDPFAVPQLGPPLTPLGPPLSSAIMQRRQRSDSRGASHGTAPTIPLPQLPAGARLNRMEGRSASPASSGSRNDLWISRTPVTTQFFAV